MLATFATTIGDDHLQWTNASMTQCIAAALPSTDVFKNVCDGEKYADFLGK